MVDTEAITFMEPSDERWLALVKQSGKANIFHHPAWLGLLADCYNYVPFIVIGLDADKELCSGLPMAQVNSLLTGQRLVSLPFTDHCVPIYRDDRALDELTSNLLLLYREKRVPVMEIRAQLPSHPSFIRYSDHVLHTLDLDRDVDSVFRQLHNMHKRNIKKATKEGVQVISGTTADDLEDFYKLHLQTRRRQGVPVQPRKFFDLLLENIIGKGLGFILLAYADDEFVAGGVFLHWQDTLTYKYGASADVGRNLRANNLIMWTAIRWGCENGYRVFDMGKTDLENSGLREFKTRWGANEEPLVYSLLSERQPRETESNLQVFMQSIIRNSPTWVCRATGELLYRHYG